MARIQIRRGLEASLPTTSMLAGELHATTDQGTLHMATDATTRIPINPDVSGLTTLASVDGTADLVLVEDASEAAAQRVKKMTFNAFKTALNIPGGSTDELVSVVSGGTAGYVWGTDGTDGIFRMASSMSWTKDAGNAYVTLAVEVVDGGTF